MRQDIFDMYMDAMTTEEHYQDEFGNDVWPQAGSYFVGTYSAELKPLTEEEAQSFRDLVSRISNVWNADEEINDIVSEESAAYFAGDRSIEDTMDIIQNRVQTYIKESE